MSLRIAMQMDPMDGIDPQGDSTWLLMAEAVRRDFALYHYPVDSLSLHEGVLTARVRPLRVAPDGPDHPFAWYGPAERARLDRFDIIWMRQDPPFDLGYITATHLLEHLPARTMVVNHPAYVRNAPEKLLVTRFARWMPPTLITRDRTEIDRFRAQHRDIIVKPLFGNGGAGVFHLREDDGNLGALTEMFQAADRAPFMVQAYLKAIREGDKRIILIDGQPAGAILRVPADGEARANLHAGARARATTLTEREREICDSLGPLLHERGLLFAGIDVIGGFLTEINVTSPTGLHETNRFDDIRLEQQIWDRVLERRAAGDWPRSEPANPSTVD